MLIPYEDIMDVKSILTKERAIQLKNTKIVSKIESKMYKLPDYIHND